MQYTSPAILGEAFSKGVQDADRMQEPALKMEQAKMVRAQYEDSMKPITLDEIGAKTSPDLWQPLERLAGSNGYIEEQNGTRFIRKGKLKEFYNELKTNAVWQAQAMDEADKQIVSLMAPVQETLGNHKQRWENVVNEYKTKIANAVDKDGNPIQTQINKLELEFQKQQQENPDYRAIQTLSPELTKLMGMHKRRMTTLGILDQGFKSDVEKYGEQDALRLATNQTTRQKLDIQQARIKAMEKGSAEWSAPFVAKVGNESVLMQRNMATGEMKRLESNGTVVNVNTESPDKKRHEADLRSGRKELNRLFDNSVVLGKATLVYEDQVKKGKQPNEALVIARQSGDVYKKVYSIKRRYDDIKQKQKGKLNEKQMEGLAKELRGLNAKEIVKDAFGVK